MDKEYIVFRVRGGLGKNVMASAVCRAISKNYSQKKLVVISTYPEVFLNNPSVYRVYGEHSSPYFYDLYIKDKNTTVFALEPYESGGFLLEKEHLIESWCKIFGITYDSELPEVFLTQREISFLNNHFLSNFKKPIVVFQPFGGPHNQDFQYNWNRDIPVSQAQKIVSELSKDFAVIQVGHKGQIFLDGAIPFIGSNRDLFSLISLSSKRVLIDSSCQHIAAALRLPSTVCWISNSPKVLGYNLHTNIHAIPANAESIHRIDSLFQPENWTGTFNHYYPYKDDSVFDVNKIIESVYNS
jgi:hypothetical protein